jgi:hypothetical protein
MAAMSRWACSDSSTRKSMLPRELIEELVGGCGATGLHILVTLANCIESFLIILALPLEVVGQRVVERVSRTLPSSAR